MCRSGRLGYQARRVDGRGLPGERPASVIADRQAIHKQIVDALAGVRAKALEQIDIIEDGATGSQSCARRHVLLG